MWHGKREVHLANANSVTAPTVSQSLNADTFTSPAIGRGAKDGLAKPLRTNLKNSRTRMS